MGDRFYRQQAEYKPKRRLKADIIASVETLANSSIPSLSKMTNKDLEKLEEVLERCAFI